MTRTKIWTGLRPVVSAALAILAWVGAVYSTLLFPEANGGKLLTDIGLFIAGLVFLFLLLPVTCFARLRWWDCLVPVAIPVYIVGWDITEYWAGRIWLAFVSPMAISAGLAAVLHRVRKRQNSGR